MAARRRLCSVAVRVGSSMGQPSAYLRAALVWSTIVRIGRRLHAMGARVFDGFAQRWLGCWVAP